MAFVWLGILAVIGFSLVAAFYFWGDRIIAGLTSIAARKAWEAVKTAVLADRMKPEDEAKWRDDKKTGGDTFNRKGGR